MRTIPAAAALMIALAPLQFSPTQDSAKPKPPVSPPLVAKIPAGGAALEFDWPALEIGVAEYDEGPTGATLFRFPKKAHVVVDARGGAPCTILTEALQYGYAESEPPFVDAICFAGGSCYGLEAASGVMDGLLEARGNSTRWGEIAYVPGAIVFDFTGRDNAVHPDRELGQAALKAAKSGRFPLGSRGAGRFVHCGSYFGPRFMERSGQGGTFRQIGLAKVAVFTVVNALGAIVGRDGAVARGNRDPKTGARTSIETDLRNGTRRVEWNDPPTAPPPKRNTTLTLVVTNVRLPFSELKRVAIEVHSSMARAIQPFHTPWDGDTLFAATTAEVDDAALGSIGVAMAASDLAWDAIASAESHAEDDPPAAKRTEK
jgi:L-aminopeptidase/D-esterase-like protein